MKRLFSRADARLVRPGRRGGVRRRRRGDPRAVGNGETLAREIPGARLLVLEHAATKIPDAAAADVAAAMLEL
jgi:hypothetical protein